MLDRRIDGTEFLTRNYCRGEPSSRKTKFNGKGLRSEDLSYITLRSLADFVAWSADFCLLGDR